MARPLSWISVLGLRPGAGRPQLLSTRGGTTVVIRPPRKKSTSAPPTAQAALLSALLNICFPPDDGRHNVVAEHDDSREDHRATEEAHEPDGFQRLDGVDEGNRGIVPRPTLPETAQPERYEEAQPAHDHEPEAPVGERVAMQFGAPQARREVIDAGDGEEGEAAEQGHEIGRAH